jgi:DNA-binding GntR family transcriptional regulator
MTRTADEPPDQSTDPVAANVSAAEQVAADLRRRILAGEILPGERIRQEEVAERFGVSRLPVREALRMLEAEGLTELETKKSARVPLLDMQQVALMYQMREKLEPLALTESIPRFTDAQIDRLDEIQARIENDDDLAHFLDLDRELHLLSYAGCDSDQLIGAVTRLWNSTQYYRRAFMTLTGPKRRWVVNAEHALLLDAIRRRDLVDAAHFSCVHIRRTRIELQHHPELFPQPGR